LSSIISKLQKYFLIKALNQSSEKLLCVSFQALQTVENAVKHLDILPDDYKDFHMKRMITFIETKIPTDKEEGQF
jgi:hypothetical protein